MGEGWTPITYETMVEHVFAFGTFNGFFGDREPVRFALYNQHVYTVTPMGYFNPGLPPVVDAREALWILEHHPAARPYTDIRPAAGIEAAAHG